MLRHRHYTVGLLLLLAASVRADTGDDFSNNLFSDLSPLLALFGERVTMQFLSQSMGWADCILLAMAPLGIITIIVSAIRVDGPPWLKAVIGRSRENLSAAEMELMSSTSQETCELWNGADVVRCQGLAPVKEFICLFPQEFTKEAKIRIMRLEEAIAKGLIREDPTWLRQLEEAIPKIPLLGELSGIVQSCRKIIQNLARLSWSSIRVRSPTFDPETPQQTTAVETPAPEIQGLEMSGLETSAPEHQRSNTSMTQASDIIILRNIRDAAPNVTLNRHDSVDRRPLHLAASFGVMLQLGVLLYFGFITYYPALKFEKDGSKVAGYAFPFSAGGTIILVLGILFCARVVDRSTEEKRYMPCDGRRTRLIWLQSKQTVSDQVFKSFALYPQNCPQVITTSGRKQSGIKPETQSSSTWELPNSETNLQSSSTPGQSSSLNLTVFSTAVCLIGFVIQFIGLRAMHWSASVGQLIAVMIMAVLRALVRRGFTDTINSVELREGYELDEFAIAFGTSDPGQDPKYSSGGTEYDFGLSRTGGWRVMMNKTDTFGTNKAPKASDISDTSETPEPSQNGNSANNGLAVVRGEHRAREIMDLRRYLARLADWRGPASTEAACLAEAIEATMDTLYPTTEIKEPSLETEPDDSSSENERTRLIQFRESSASEIKLSESPPKVFTWSIRVCLGKPEETTETVDLHVDRNGGSWKSRLDELESVLCLWLCTIDKEREASTSKSDVSSKALEEDSDTWLREKRSRAGGGLIVLGKWTRELDQALEWWMPADGPKPSKMERVEFEQWRVVGTDVPDPSEDEYTAPKSTEAENHDNQSNCERAASQFLAIPSQDPLSKLYAKHIFHAFIWKAVQNMRKPIDDHSEIEPLSGPGPEVWQYFRLRCDGLSKLAQSIHNTGLGDLHDAYLALIPPLHSTSMLGKLDSVVDMVSGKAKQHIRLLDWTKAGEAYVWLFGVAKAFPTNGYIYSKAVAMMVEYVRTLTFLREDLEDERATSVKDELSSLLEHDADQALLAHLQSLYIRQQRAWSPSFFQFIGSPPSLDNTSSDNLGFTRTHDLVAMSVEEATHVPEGNVPGFQDIPRAGLVPAISFPKRSLPDGLRKEVDAQDILGWTPLHYAAVRGSRRWTKPLLEAGANPNAGDLLEWMPLHYACIFGNPQMTDRLLERGAKVNAKGVDGMTPLHCAASGNNSSVVERLVSHHTEPADQFAKDNFGRAPIHLAVLRRNRSVVEQLALSIDVTDSTGQTPLHLSTRSAAWERGDPVMDWLLILGANVKVKNRGGMTPLHQAAANGNVRAISKLVEKGANIEALVENRRYTALHIAAESGKTDPVKKLVDLKANVNARDDIECTPLHSAAASGHVPTIDVLISNGADVNAKSSFNHTPLFLAASGGREEAVARFLQEENIETDVVSHTSGGVTALDEAAFGGHTEIVRRLVEKGATINEETVQLARVKKHDDIVQILLWQILPRDSSLL